MMASNRSCVECVKLLLDTGASADLSDKVRAGSHQVLSVWHVPLGIVEFNNVYESCESLQHVVLHLNDHMPAVIV